MKVFHRYLCELCSNAVARQRGQDEYEFVICAMSVNGFPTGSKCSQFQLEEGVME